MSTARGGLRRGRPGHDRGLRLLHPGFAPIHEAFLPGWIVIVNREGQQFLHPFLLLDNEFSISESGGKGSHR